MLADDSPARAPVVVEVEPIRGFGAARGRVPVAPCQAAGLGTTLRHEGRGPRMIDATTVRTRYVEMLMERVREVEYPSNDQLNRIEALLTPDTVDDYLEFLMEKVEEARFPSVTMLDRIEGLTTRLPERASRRERDEG
jgi:hypothetical protein